MPQADIAQAWKSFSPERRSGLLAKMTAEQKKNLRRAIEGAGPEAAARPDFTANPKGEGLYEMQGPDGNLHVPYSKVIQASQGGFRVKPEIRERYARDRRAEILKAQPRITEQDYLKAMQMPEEVPSSPGLWQRIEGGVQTATEPTNYFPGTPQSQYDPALGEMGLNTVKRIGRVLFGVVDFAPEAFGALKDSLSDDPEKAADGETRLLEMHPGAQIHNRVKELRQDFRTDPKLAVSNVAGDVAGMWLAGKAMEMPAKGSRSLSVLRRSVAERFGPRSVELAGEKVPVTIGEAAPESAAGRTQANLKRSGVGAQKFEKLENAQQAAVKQVIRRTAQETSGFVGPMQDEPGAAMQDAADATFAKARPLYRTLDKSLMSVPATLQGVSRLVQNAIVRARKLGATIGDDTLDISKIVPDKDGSIQWGGTRISKTTHPARWAKLVGDGIIDDSGQRTPLSAYMKTRSQLLKMQRSSSDPAMRNAIANEVRTMNENMQTALKGTPLSGKWANASRLWSKAYALRDVADAITEVTKGTPAAQQAPGLTPVPTKLQGAGLVARLNTLADDGILERAFTPEETANLRKSADILDRIQRNPVGKGSGESVSRTRGLTHAVSGAKGPLIGAGIGFLVGHGLYGAEAGAGIGFIVQAIGERALVGVMTKLDGVDALRALEVAKTPREATAALKALATIAAASSAAKQPVKSLKELRDEAARRKPSVNTPANALQGH